MDGWTRRREKMSVVSAPVSDGLQTFLEDLWSRNQRLIVVLGVGNTTQGIRPCPEKIDHVVPDAPIDGMS